MARADFTELHYLAESAEWRTDRYYTYDLLTELLRDWAAAYPTLATLGSIGRSGAGREIWLLTITNAATGPDHEKPAYYIDANIHAGETTTSAVALATIHHLLTRYESDPTVRRIVDETTVYIIPRIAVDGGELFLTTAEAVRSVAAAPDAPTPDGLIPQDLDGDGLIGSMRIKDPAGPWKISPRDGRIMLPRGPGEFGGDYYFVHPEGLSADWDGGAIRVAPPSPTLDFNRNFPSEWRAGSVQFGAGAFPLSAPETRALADFVLGHPNIHGAQLHHTAAGLILRASALYGDERLPPLDLRAYKAIGAMGEAATGYRCDRPSTPIRTSPTSPHTASTWTGSTMSAGSSRL